MSVGIITSAAYVNAEMSAEFGLLPPAFLPAGNTRLFKYQASLLHKFADRVVLSLPESFIIPEQDATLLGKLDVAVVRIPDGLSLGESVMLAIIQSIEGNEPVVVLHGDTLFIGLEQCPADTISVHRKDHPYPWAVVRSESPLQLGPSDDGNGALIVSGLFSFSSSLVFLRCLAQAGEDFIAALNRYARTHGLASAEGGGTWLDFGHLNTYYESRRALTTERAFNTLSITADTVTKTSSQPDKIEAEALWYEALPAALSAYVPAYLGRASEAGREGYRLSYEYLCTLGDLYVFGALPAKVWRRVFTRCAEVLAAFRSFKPAVVEPAWFDSLYAGKTLARLAQFAGATGISLDEPWIVNDRECPPLRRIVERLADVIGPALPEDCGILHGDFCLSNILYDFRRDSPKLIDPRGLSAPGQPAMYGDTRYDLGKLHHSIVGRYDFIVAGYYDLASSGPYNMRLNVAAAAAQHQIERLFSEIVCGGSPHRLRTAAAISVLLFLSMLPLHADDQQRQWAFLANACRLYLQHFGGSS